MSDQLEDAAVGTQPATLARLRADFERITAMPQVQAQLEKRGARPVQISAPEAELLLARDLDKWAQLIRTAGINAD